MSFLLILQRHFHSDGCIKIVRFPIYLAKCLYFLESYGYIA